MDIIQSISMVETLDRINQGMRLKDGRWLSYAVYGDHSGKPLLYFHGMPGSRLLHPPEDVTAKMGVRLIIVERPGFGRSDFLPARTLLGWADDVVELADGLGLERFPLVGISAGGPFAAACACRIPHRLTLVGMVGSVGPLEVPGSMKEMPPVRVFSALVAQRAPWLLLPMLNLMGNPARNPERFYQRMLSGNSPRDLAILRQPQMKACLIASYAEATRSGVRGMAQEGRIISNPWGFRLEDIRVPVHLWFGEEDHNVSISAARHMAQTIPGCRAEFLPGEGHWLFLSHWEEILAVLTST
jgi:pimeloyl-ACP methyl ester carboxylesterase